MRHIRARGWTLNRLARALNISPSALSQARRRPKDPLYRKMRDIKACTVELLTGWPSTDWP